MENARTKILRNHCELCGGKLKTPETNNRKLAMCDKCVDGNMLGKMLRGTY